MQGKTTLLKIIGGLAQHDTGMVRIGSGALDVATAAIGSGGSDGDGSIASAAGSSGNGSGSGNGSTGSDGGGGASAAAARTAQTGLVFQFPERHFLVLPAATLWCCLLPQQGSAVVTALMTQHDDTALMTQHRCLRDDVMLRTMPRWEAQRTQCFLLTRNHPLTRLGLHSIRFCSQSVSFLCWSAGRHHR